MTKDVLFSIKNNGLAFITLNRPEALHSLTYEMVKAIGTQISLWEENPAIKLIVIKGAGDKGFCAGGDIKTLYQAQFSQNSLKEAERFFEEEYRVDQLIYSTTTPIIACLDGIVMGGGVGLTYGADYRIVTERTKWAMPEMNIGFFPDVGASYFLNKAPGLVGRYLALTAASITAADVLYINAADFYLTSNKLQELITRIETIDWEQGQVHSEVKKLILDYSSEPASSGSLAKRKESIDRHFAYFHVEDIIGSLEKDKSEFAARTRETLLSKSPSSLKIALKQLIDARKKTREECFAVELVLAKNFLKHADFFEGIRSVLIDKDYSPQYKYVNLYDFSERKVQKFFE